ncbi:MAG TPA: ABC transporter substrate-binding protein [Candidatus Binatia bacterium]|nr:ABC transporter substrate-binding protein [Candidatus Binatia bacterium]
MSYTAIAFVLVALALVSFRLTEAQQPRKVAQIGFLMSSASSDPRNPSRLDAFRQALRNLGYVEGKNIAIEYRYAEGKLERLPELAAELVRLQVDIIITAGNEPAEAAKNVTQKIPIVMAFSGDAVGLGFVSSLARPGGNMTGLTNLALELSGKRLELLKELVPGINRVATLFNPEGPAPVLAFKEAHAAAQGLGLKLESMEVRVPTDLDTAFRAAVKERADALMTLPGAFPSFHRKRIVDLAAKNRLPAVYPEIHFADVGGLMSYGSDRSEEFRRAAYFVDKILKGAKSSDLPVEQPTKFELVINLKTAKQIGLTIPPTVLARADKIIK